jgi:hypothetical protein
MTIMQETSPTGRRPTALTMTVRTAFPALGLRDITAGRYMAVSIFLFDSVRSLNALNFDFVACSMPVLMGNIVAELP